MIQIKQIDMKYQDRMTALIPFLFGFFFLASSYLTLEFYEAIDYCPDFGRGQGKVKKMIMITSNIICIFFFPYILRVVCNLKNHSIFIINCISLIGSIISLILVIFIVVIFFTVPDTLEDVDDSERVSLEMEKQCCYTDYIKSSSDSVNDINGNENKLYAEVYCTCPLLTDIEKQNRVSDNDMLCMIETEPTKICCNGSEFQSSNVYLFFFFDTTAFLVGFLSSIIGFIRLQKKFKYFTSVWCFIQSLFIKDMSYKELKELTLQNDESKTSLLSESLS